MIRDTEKLTKTSRLLLYLLAAKDAVEPFLAYPTLSKVLYPEVDKYYRDKRLDNTIRRLIKQGWIKTEYVEAKKIISLTAQGQLEALFEKARATIFDKTWDGKWRIVMFDIPEAAEGVRHRLRYLLKSFGFKALQASVYVFPYAISKAMVIYLKESGLSRYIRMARADFDDDTDLRKLFKLPPAIFSGRRR